MCANDVHTTSVVVAEFSYRTCDVSGQWMSDPSGKIPKSVGWTDYSQCYPEWLRDNFRVRQGGSDDDNNNNNNNNNYYYYYYYLLLLVHSTIFSFLAAHLLNKLQFIICSVSIPHV